MNKPPKSFRLDPKLIERCKRVKLDLPKMFEAAMAKALKDKICPYCNGRMGKR